MHQKQVAAHKAQLDWLQAFKGGLAASGDLRHGRFSTEAVLYDTLRPSFDQVIENGGHLWRAEGTRTFILLNDRLYQVSHDTCTEEKHT